MQMMVAQEIAGLLEKPPLRQDNPDNALQESVRGWQR